MDYEQIKWKLIINSKGDSSLLSGFFNCNRAVIVVRICSSFLGYFEESVRQYQVVDSVHSRIGLKLRINVEEDLQNQVK